MGGNDILAWGLDCHKETLSKCVSQQVIYKCPPDEVAVCATLGRHERLNENEQGLAIKISQQDFIIDRCKLVLGGELHKPCPGDLICWDNGKGELVTFEVTNEGTEPGYDWLDQYQKCYRIHTEECRREAII